MRGECNGLLRGEFISLLRGDCICLLQGECIYLLQGKCIGVSASMLPPHGCVRGLHVTLLPALLCLPQPAFTACSKTVY